jgi:putative ABC transport system permease protein
LSALESVVHTSAADVPVYHVQRMEDVLAASMERERMATVVLTMFAGVALMLAAVGLYGLVSHGVVERRHEIGVRMALGASAAQILRLVVGSGLALAAAGAAIGIGGAIAATRALEGLLFGVTPNDPGTLAAVAAMLLVVAVIACVVPGVRAMRIAPSDALRA